MKRLSSIGVKHNIEVAHRLFELPGKCEQIHGHSMWITLDIEGEVNEHGILAGLEFGALKNTFRSYLDSEFDHRLLLNQDDPFAGELMTVVRDEHGEMTDASDGGLRLPGLRACPGDPTTENIAFWVLDYMKPKFLADGVLPVKAVSGLAVTVWETSVNKAEERVYFQ